MQKRTDKSKIELPSKHKLTYKELIELGFNLSTLRFYVKEGYIEPLTKEIAYLPIKFQVFKIAKLRMYLSQWGLKRGRPKK